MPVPVSLDPYRTPGVRLFSGENRGHLVGQDIREKYGEDVSIEVPPDIISLTWNFWRGMMAALPNAVYPFVWLARSQSPFDPFWWGK